MSFLLGLLENWIAGIFSRDDPKGREKMNPTHEDQVAAFRYGLIAPIVCRQTPLLPGELKAYMDEVAGQVYDIPGSTRQQVSVKR